MTAAQDLSWLRALHEPAQALGWTLAQWDHRVRVARRLRLLGRLAESVLGAGLAPELPPPVVHALRAETRLAQVRAQALQWCRECVGDALHGLAVPLVLLKGAAYIAQGLPNAAGRLPSDLDILVPADVLPAARARLLAAGWREVPLDEHDQRYYREWSHELPPMRHPMHAIELDVHHNIAPPVARDRVDATLLLQAARPLRGGDEAPWWVLSPEDQVLHCAAHLINDSEQRDRLRDLVDLHVLIVAHGQLEAGFGQRLLARAQALGLGDALVLAASLSASLVTPHLVGSPRLPPEPALQQAVHEALAQPRLARLHRRYATVLTPRGPAEEPGLGVRLAETALLLRHHWRRMPLSLLLRHTWHKVWAPRRTDAEADSTDA
jgi:hypothetical protein